MGRIIQTLGENGMLENSIVVFMSDNGAPTTGFFSNSGSNYPLREVYLFVKHYFFGTLHKLLLNESTYLNLESLN